FLAPFDHDSPIPPFKVTSTFPEPRSLRAFRLCAKNVTNLGLRKIVADDQCRHPITTANEFERRRCSLLRGAELSLIVRKLRLTLSRFLLSGGSCVLRG